MKRISPLVVILFLSCVFQSSAAIINGYAKVTGVASGTTLNVTNVNETYHSFTAGEYVVLMQMQDNVTFSTTSGNFSNNTTAIGQAGLYEIRKIELINYSSPGIISQIVLDPITNSYSFNSHSSVQLITFRKMSASNYTTTFDITALPWDGSIGGVIAMEIPGTLTLNNNIIADGTGFRGGFPSDNYDESSCNNIAGNVTTSERGFKGEGVYANPINTNGYLRIATGGGGGSSDRSGGGGGSNWNTGGNGDDCNIGGGNGGDNLNAFYNTNTPIGPFNRVFLGGGGGGGQQRISGGTAGGNGGGIILIKASNISDPCPHSKITANGNGALNPTLNDGAGGGGAGGMIILDVATWQSSNCTGSLQIQASGGAGGDGGNSHSGAGGGIGMILFIGISSTPTEVSASASLGNSPGNASDGSTSGTEVFYLNNIITPLPVELTFFNAVLLENETVQLAWQTAAEINSANFTLERSINGVNWEEIGKVNAAGNSTEEINYSFQDKRPYDGVSYYRLTQSDLDGQTKDLGIRSIIRNGEEIIVFPNPAENRIEFQGPIGSFECVELYDILGHAITSSVSFDLITERQLTMTIDHLESGIYFLKTKDEIIRFVKK